MVVSKITSLLVVVSFFVFLVVAGLSLGLMAVSAFSTGAEAMNSVTPVNTIANAHCGDKICNLP